MQGVWQWAKDRCLTPETIRREVDCIRCMTPGPRRAARERRLLRDVLQAINDSLAEDARCCAFVALQASPRDYAKRYPRSRSLERPKKRRMKIPGQP